MMNVKLNLNGSIPSWRRGLGRLMLMIFMTLFITMSSFASSTENFTKANAFYTEGKYQEAIESYQAILSQDQFSTDIYFNLGNCYYKTDDIPNSILYYEKALKLQPDNEDALFNLKMANKKTIDKIDRLPELFIGNTWRTLVTSKTVESWAYYSVGLIFLSLLLFISYLLMQQVIIKKAGFYAGFLFLGLSMFTLLMASQHNAIVEQATEAIIFAPTTTIQSEPNTNAEKLFTLHEGTKVTLLQESADWSKIKLPNGNVGWIKSEEIKSI
ncbi:MAG: tetratricopeptide repeat protein [Vicingaceae bacterium]